MNIVKRRSPVLFHLALSDPICTALLLVYRYMCFTFTIRPLLSSLIAFCDFLRFFFNSVNTKVSIVFVFKFRLRTFIDRSTPNKDCDAIALGCSV